MILYRLHIAELILISLPLLNCSKLQEEEISRWAKDFGDELWKLGKAVTKIEEIQQKYLHANAQVEKKDIDLLLVEVVKDIEQMMDRKMDAIRCISDAAERAAELYILNSTTFEYYSSKYSSVIDEPPAELPNTYKNKSYMYMNMTLNKDTHFYNLPVNTNYSSVHVPTNIFDEHEEAASAIQWSEELDTVFSNNYNFDPALSWQYFGSSSGIMRHFPAKKWTELEKDEFDCRTRTWFIEASTCTKDVVILLDNSGSMDGMGRHIAALTATSILETFSNNDFINVMYYNVTTNYTVPCFKDMLVQATPENVNLFKDAIKGLSKPLGKTQLSQALQTAFDLLARYREIRGCVDLKNDTSAENNITCNQAIMIITDGISKNLSDIVMKYNYLDGGSNIPVRLFTYLIGKEVANVDELLWMSCANRGYYSHVQTLEQVTSSVLKYIDVIARPLVLQGGQIRPISWTHAYVDMNYNDKTDDQINEPYRLLTSAAVPAFDIKANRNNENRTANLLGVAGTDVPLDDIKQLTLPYKIGVNAYAFMVSNNGYILMHRDFRPTDKKGNLRTNYNSIDLTEVEQFGKDLPPRQLDEDLLNLRNSIINSSAGNILGIPIKYHYDDMRRVIRKKYDYYFAPLKNTPFSLAFAIPDGYGHYSLDVGDEIMKNRHTGAKITDFFKGFKWRIHPKWVYCKYHYIEGHEYKTPESEITHFLKKMYSDDFVWERQYETSEEEKDEDLDLVKCNRTKAHGNDDYYCDRQLVQRLVFDAKNTVEAFRGWANQTGEAQIFDRFNVTLRFIATMSGLTSWEYRSDSVKPNGKEFGDLHPKAIDETWYKSAVIQHEYDSESFVYSVPFENKDDMSVTGSYAIFPTDAGIKAPGCVVGFQFSHQKLSAKFKESTSKVSNQCLHCEACFHTLKCYLIDNNGYIVASEHNDFTGQFFGEIEGDIMNSLLKENIFEKVTIYDYQAICNRNDDIAEPSKGNILSNPANFLILLFDWFIAKIAWLAMEISIHNLLAPFYTQAQNFDTVVDTVSQFMHHMDSISEGEGDDDLYDCEKERDLYILQQHLFLHNNDYGGKIHASRPYYIKKIPYSNLLLIAINTTTPRTNRVKYSVQPRPIIYENDMESFCIKAELTKNLPRRRLTGCFDEHPLEREIKACGKGVKNDVSHTFVPLIIINVYFLCQ